MKKSTPTYPIINDESVDIRAANQRPLSDITVEAAAAGNLTSMDLRISADTLQKQADIAAEGNYGQLAANLKRAAELTDVPNEELLRMYNALRPHRATYEILQALAKTLEEKYDAPLNAKLVREAAEVYHQRGLLLT